MAKTKMTMKLSTANRAWNMLRLAVVWARKGNLIKRRLVMDLHLALKSLKRSSKDESSIKYYYGNERELSFDETPMIRVKMYKPTSSMRFRIPCFTPGDDEIVDFDYIVDDHDRYNCKYAIEDHDAMTEEEEEEDVNTIGIANYNDDDGDEHIDERADRFIAEFYAQMRLQRQISRLNYK